VHFCLYTKKKIAFFGKASNAKEKAFTFKRCKCASSKGIAHSKAFKTFVEWKEQ
jgi:hypothetical protein